MRSRCEDHLDNSASATERRKLAADLHNAQAARELIRAAADTWSLHQALRGQAHLKPRTRRAAGRNATTHAPRRGRRDCRRRRRTPLVLGLSLAAAAATVLALLLGVPARDPAPAPAEVRLLDQRGPLPTGFARDLAAGRPLAFGAGSSCVFGLGPIDGRVTVTGPARFTLVAPARLRCSRGVFGIELAELEAGTTWELTTPHASCRVLGTRFTVRVGQQATELQVASGRVAFAAADGSGAQMVGAGGSASTSGAPQALLHYPFDATGAAVLRSRNAGFPAPSFVCDPPPQTRDGGLVVTPDDHCTTPVRQRWPELAARLRRGRGLTLAARIRCLDPPPPNTLVAELFAIIPDNPDASPTPFPIQVRYRETPDTRTHVFAVVWTVDGALMLYRDGKQIYRGEKPYQLDRLSDELQLKLFMPRRHHEPAEGLSGIVFHDLWLFDRALDADELAGL